MSHQTIKLFGATWDYILMIDRELTKCYLNLKCTTASRFRSDVYMTSFDINLIEKINPPHQAMATGLRFVLCDFVYIVTRTYNEF